MILEETVTLKTKRCNICRIKLEDKNPFFLDTNYKFNNEINHIIISDMHFCVSCANQIFKLAENADNAYIERTRELSNQLIPPDFPTKSLFLNS